VIKQIDRNIACDAVVEDLKLQCITSKVSRIAQKQRLVDMVDVEVPRDQTGGYNLNKVRNLEMRCESMKHRKGRNARTAERRTLQAIGDVLRGPRHRRTKPETPGSNLLVLLLVTRKTCNMRSSPLAIPYQRQLNIVRLSRSIEISATRDTSDALT
jgi:hypothetical protein